MGLTVAELSKMVDYYKQKTIELNSELNGYKEKSSKWKLLIEKLGSQVKQEFDKLRRLTAFHGAPPSAHGMASPLRVSIKQPTVPFACKG